MVVETVEDTADNKVAVVDMEVEMAVMAAAVVSNSMVGQVANRPIWCLLTLTRGRIFRWWWWIRRR